MPKTKYPLEALRDVREARVDEATSALAKAVRAREDAATELARTEAARIEQRRIADEKRASERSALESGALKVADLAREDAWEHGVKAEADALAKRAAQAKSREETARDEERSAREALAAKKAEVDVVEKDKARFVGRQNERELAHEEQEANEAWRPKRA